MDIAKEPFLPGFHWIVGCALPLNASLICKYLFEKNSNRIKPQFQSSLLNCQIYSSAFANIFHPDKPLWKSFTAVSEQLINYEFGWIPNLQKLCESLELLQKKNEFTQELHTEFIECLMLICSTKLAPAESLRGEIARLLESNMQLTSSEDLSNVKPVDINSSDFVNYYVRLTEIWLEAVTRLVISEMAEVRGNQVDSLPRRMNVISLLSCGAYHYRHRIMKIFPSLSNEILLKAQLAVLDSTQEPIADVSCSEEDRLNVSGLLALLGVIGEAKKGHATWQDSSHNSIITAVSCALPVFVGCRRNEFLNLAAVCSASTFFYWFTQSEVSNGLTFPTPRGEFFTRSPKIQSADETVMRNSLALQSLVRTSAGLAKKARAANPESVPTALVNLDTVEQLVSSTTSNSSERCASTNGACCGEELLSELACTAALASVDSVQTNCSNAQSGPVYPVKHSGEGVGSVNPFFLKTAFESTDGNHIHRSPAYSTYKLPTSNKKPASSSTAEDEGYTVAKQHGMVNSPPVSQPQDIVSTTQSLSPQQENRTPPTAQTSQLAPRTSCSIKSKCWAETASQRNKENQIRSVAPSPKSPPTSTVDIGKGTVALRLSLDQRRRAIETSRQRALREGDKVAADKHQMAFLALLHSSQKRRFQIASEKDPSIVEEEHSEALDRETDDYDISQDDVHLPEESVAEVEEITEHEPNGAKYSSTHRLGVEYTGTEDSFSVYLPEQVEMPYTQELHESSVYNSPNLPEPLSIGDASAPKANHHPMPISTSSSSVPSSPSDQPRKIEYHVAPNKFIHPRQHASHSFNHQHRPESCCSLCNPRELHGTESRCRRKNHLNSSGDPKDGYNNDSPDEFYSTLPVRRVSKTPRGTRQQHRPIEKSSYPGRCFSPEDVTEPHRDDKGFYDETASEIHWDTHNRSTNRPRKPSRQRLSQYQLSACDSSEELSYPVRSRAFPQRRNIAGNHLGKSAGTGLDALAIAELARSVSTLREDIERLTAQQQSLLAASRADLQGTETGVDVNLGPPRSSTRPHLSTTPTSSTRAMWSTRAPLRYPSQCDIHDNVEDMKEVNDELQSPVNNASIPPSSVDAILTEKTPECKQIENQTESTTKPLHQQPECIKPAEKLFIGFDDIKLERFRKARERLEARRTVSNTKFLEGVHRARIAEDEAHFIEEISQMNQKLQPIPVETVASSDLDRIDNGGFPVHSSNASKKRIVDKVGPNNCTTPPKSSRPVSSKCHDFKAPEIAQKNTNTHGRSSRSSSLSRPTARSLVTSSSGTNQSTSASFTSRVTSTNGRRDVLCPGIQRPASRQSTGRLTTGPSLSSLHRLENGDESTYSGPGLAYTGILPQTRLYVKPKAKSNRQVIVNAISHCCLAGTVNESSKKTALQELAAADGSHFMILFRDSRCQYRALYAFDFDMEELRFICGSGPRKITHAMCCNFFKYNSGAKQFSEITSTKHLSAVVDAITIQNSWWVRGPPLYSSSTARTAAATNVNASETSDEISP